MWLIGAAFFSLGIFSIGNLPTGVSSKLMVASLMFLFYTAFCTLMKTASPRHGTDEVHA